MEGFPLDSLQRDVTSFEAEILERELGLVVKVCVTQPVHESRKRRLPAISGGVFAPVVGCPPFFLQSLRQAVLDPGRGERGSGWGSGGATSLWW